MTFPKHIQQAVDLGLLTAEDGRITGVGSEESETILGISRLMEKIQPTTKQDQEDTTDQEAIVLIRVLSSPHGTARELWSDLRVAVGVGHGQNLPKQLWSTDVFQCIGGLIDRIYTDQEASGAKIIGKETLIQAYYNNGNQRVGIQDFTMTVDKLCNSNSMKAYGDAGSEWEIALDLLRQQRARANFLTAQHIASTAVRTDAKLAKAIEAQQNELMTCLGMLRGSVGNQGNAVDAVADLLCPQNGGDAFMDQIMNARAQTKPVSTGLRSMDIDMEGGVRRPGESQGGRLFTLAARTGVGKTILGVYSAVNLAYGGLTVGFISAELDKASIYARIWAASTYVHAKGNYDYVSQEQKKNDCVTVGDIESPPSNKKERDKIGSLITAAAGAMQNNGGKILVEDPWGADVDSVVNSLRSMKAKNPELRCVVLDHFHVLARHKDAPNSDAAMLEDRAYRLMNCAKQLEIDLIVLAQMNRIGMSVGDNSAPTLDQIRGTDALSHVSHAVWIVRRETNKDDDPAKKTDKPLELHHAKTRGRQAFWNNKDQRMQGAKRFVDVSILGMDYPFSAVSLDDTVIG